MTRPTAPPRPAYRILLVSDNLPQRDTQAGVLLTHGYQVDCIGSLVAGQRCRETAPDLVLVGIAADHAAAFSLLEVICRGNPRQRFGFFLEEEERLSSVLVDGKIVVASQSSGDLLSDVATRLHGE